MKKDYYYRNQNKYTICCNCGIEMNESIYPTCRLCHNNYRQGTIYTECIHCGHPFPKPKRYGTCFFCYEILRRKNYDKKKGRI